MPVLINYSIFENNLGIGSIISPIFIDTKIFEQIQQNQFRGYKQCQKNTKSSS